MPVTRTLVSILNWNKAEETAACVRQVLAALPNADRASVTIVVTDNGSAREDVDRLSSLVASLPAVELRLNPRNEGFAGGHNALLRRAVTANFDFVWLLNNDTMVPAGCLDALLDTMAAQPKCGAVSPVILSMHPGVPPDSCGNAHDWKSLGSIRARDLAQGMALQDSRPDDFWLNGTAILYRVSALREVGLLDEAYFAYYEDDDMGVRLGRGGWRSRMNFQASVLHDTGKVRRTDKSALFFYLMARNVFRFWEGHSPATARRLLRTRLTLRGLGEAKILRQAGLAQKHDAVLKGVADGLARRWGEPDMQRAVPRWMRAAMWLPTWRLHRIVERVAGAPAQSDAT